MASRPATFAPWILAALALQGCSPVGGPPSIAVFGSFFPAWIACAIGGLVAMMLIRFLLIAAKLDEHLPAPPLVYLCVAVSAGIGLWMFWSGAS